MKRICFVLAIFLLIASCNTSPVEKPEHLLSEDEMVDVLYDISILQATQNFKALILVKNDINVNSYIFEKYKIDSLVYQENHKYYASKPKLYQKITDEVLNRLKEKEVEIDSLDKKINPKELLQQQLDTMQ